jgi:hypothetical protein
MITYAKHTLKPDFIRKVLRSNGLDTRNYRYAVKYFTDIYHRGARVVRLPLKDLDTTAALAPWERVWEDVNYDGKLLSDQIAREED